MIELTHPELMLSHNERLREAVRNNPHLEYLIDEKLEALREEILMRIPEKRVDEIQVLVTELSIKKSKVRYK